MIQPTQWKKGAIIGGVLGGIAGLLLTRAFCEERCVEVGMTTVVGGAALFAITGALIGGSFRKPGSDNRTIGRKAP